MLLLPREGKESAYREPAQDSNGAIEAARARSELRDARLDLDDCFSRGLPGLDAMAIAEAWRTDLTHRLLFCRVSTECPTNPQEEELSAQPANILKALLGM